MHTRTVAKLCNSFSWLSLLAIIHKSYLAPFHVCNEVSNSNKSCHRATWLSDRFHKLSDRLNNPLYEYKCICTNIQTYLHTCIYIDSYVCIYTYVCIFIHKVHIYMTICMFLYHWRQNRSKMRFLKSMMVASSYVCTLPKTLCRTSFHE